MNRPTELRLATFGSLLCFLAFAPGASAQASNPSSGGTDDEIIELSPFRVDSSRDRGYSVARDVSGSRLATDLKDIAAPITVFNAEMLQDIGAINVNEALDFAPNTTYQEFGINNQDFNQVPITSRGLNGATVTQDFFPVFDDLDTYKVDRIGFGRGPNSILFGVGVPGGTITATTKQANLKRNAFETQFRFDSVGSARGLFDASYLIKEDRAAIRAVVMQQYQTKLPRPQYRKDLRVFLTGTVKLVDRPGLRTTLRGNYERIDGNDLYPNGGLPRNGVDNWIAAGRPTSSQVRAGNSPTRPPGTANVSSGQQLVYINDPANPNIPILNWQNMLRASGTNEAVLDESIYPYDKSVKGSDGVAPKFMEHYSAFLEQQLGKNFFVELAAFHGEEDRDWPFQVGGVTLDADPNEFLPNGQPNPNVGKYYVQYDGRSAFRYNKNDVYRATASYRLAFDEINPKLGWLGWHQIFGLYERYDRERREELMQLVNTTPLPGFPTDLSSTANRVFMRSYLDYDKGIWGFAPGSPSGEYTSGGVTARSMPVGAQTASLQKFESTVFAMQNHFWNNRIVTTFGWREDFIRSHSVNGQPDARGLRPLARTLTPQYVGEGSLRPSSKGVVFHAFPWLSFHYNESNNFSGLASVQRNADGQYLPATSGTGEDYGFTVHLLKDKLSVNVDFYETAQRNSVGNANADREINQFWDAMGMPEKKLDPWPATKDNFDVAAEGWEATIIYNPTPNWRIYGTISKSEASQANVYPTITRYIRDNLATWQAVPGNTTIADGRTFAEAIEDMLELNVQRRAQEGVQEFNMRKWNGSLVTNYTFSEGFLKGFSLGASALYRGDATVAYPLDASGNPVKDKPYIEDGYIVLNLNFAYEMQLRDRYTWRTQLQLNNANDWDGRVLVTQRSATGTVNSAGSRYLQGTTVVLTTGLKF